MRSPVHRKQNCDILLRVLSKIAPRTQKQWGEWFEHLLESLPSAATFPNLPRNTICRDEKEWSALLRKDRVHNDEYVVSTLNLIQQAIKHCPVLEKGLHMLRIMQRLREVILLRFEILDSMPRYSSWVKAIETLEFVTIDVLTTSLQDNRMDNILARITPWVLNLTEIYRAYYFPLRKFEDHLWDTVRDFFMMDTLERIMRSICVDDVLVSKSADLSSWICGFRPISALLHELVTHPTCEIRLGTLLLHNLQHRALRLLFSLVDVRSATCSILSQSALPLLHRSLLNIFHPHNVERFRRGRYDENPSEKPLEDLVAYSLKTVQSLTLFDSQSIWLDSYWKSVDSAKTRIPVAAYSSQGLLVRVYPSIVGLLECSEAHQPLVGKCLRSIGQLLDL